MNQSTKSIAVKSQRLTREQVRSAIFVDYEGNRDSAPTLLGWRIDSQNFCAVIEPAFATCTNRYRIRDTDFRVSQELTNELIERAHAEMRMIVSWSEHDLRLLQHSAFEKNLPLLQSVYRNALRTVKPWHGRTFGHAPENATLEYFCRLFGIKTPDAFGTGIVGSGLRHLRRQLDEDRRWDQLSPLARREWIGIVKHNRYDLMNMEEVLRGVLAD